MITVLAANVKGEKQHQALKACQMHSTSREDARVEKGAQDHS